MTTTTVRATRPGILHFSLWIAQVILAGLFLTGGSIKLFTPIDELSKMMPWAADMPGLTRFIGLAELLGAVGLILPSALRIKPGLTIWAAIGLATIMLLAFIFHVTRAEVAGIDKNVLLGGLAVFVAWGRSGRARIAPRP